MALSDWFLRGARLHIRMYYLMCREGPSFEDKALPPSRSIVAQHVGDVKTKASGKSIPRDDTLINELLLWRAVTPYADDGNYVFESTKRKGEQPYWMSIIMQVYIKPVEARHSAEGVAYSSLQLHDVAQTER